MTTWYWQLFFVSHSQLVLRCNGYHAWLLISRSVDQTSQKSFYLRIKGIIASEGELWREQRRFVHTVLKDFGMGRRILEPKIHEEIQVIMTHGPQRLWDGTRNSWAENTWRNSGNNDTRSSKTLGWNEEFSNPKFRCDDFLYVNSSRLNLLLVYSVRLLLLWMVTWSSFTQMFSINSRNSVTKITYSTVPQCQKGTG